MKQVYSYTPKSANYIGLHYWLFWFSLYAGVQREFVEISVFYCLKEPASIQNGVNPTAEREKNDINLICCLIRFIREITKDVEDQWSVNMIHHYRC